MNLALLLPAGLAALAALLLPLLIHLARRSEHRPTVFAALRWLRAAPRPRRRIRFDEWPLLLVRLLLLALLALLLAQPVLLGRDERTPHVAVAPGVDPAQARAAVADAAQARWLWLAPGFPAFDTQAPDAPSAQASLLRELDATLPPAAALTVVVPRQWSGLDGQVPVLSRRVRWQVVDAALPATTTAESAPPSLRVFAADDTRSRGALHYLRALQAAWHDDGRALDVQPATAASRVPPPTTTAVWLAATPPPEPLLHWARAGGTLLLDARAPLPQGLSMQPQWRNDAGDGVLDGAALGQGRVLRFARVLDPAALPPLLDAAFPERLRAVLQPPPPPQRAFASTQVPTTGAAPSPAAPQPLAPWLALAIALLFLLERGLATSPRRGRLA